MLGVRLKSRCALDPSLQQITRLLGQSPLQECPLVKPLTSLGLSLFIFKMEGEAVHQNCSEELLGIPCHLSQAGKPSECGSQDTNGEEAQRVEEPLQRMGSSFPTGWAQQRLGGTEATTSASSAF